MSALPEREPGRWCRSVALRLPDDADAPAAARSALAGGPAAGRLWIQDVPAAADSARAIAWRDAEMRRPVDPAIGPRARTVLLRYADGAVDLVVVSHHAPERDPGRAPAPDWGLGGTGTEGAAVAYPISPPMTPADLAAALGLVLGRYTGADRVRVGWHPGRVISLDVGPNRTAGDYRAAVSAAVAGSGEPVAGEPPVAGVAVGPPVPGAVDAYAFLAPPYPLSIAVAVGGAALWCRPGEVAPDVAAGFARHLANAVARLAALAPGQRLAEVELLDGEEQRAVAELGGLGRGEVRPPRLIHHLVAERAAETPDAQAVVMGSDRLTYRELDERADRVARALRDRGVRVGDRVGVRLERSPQLVAVLLGVLKTGAAYVPLDPAWPAERLAFVAADAGLAMLVGAGPADTGGVVVTDVETLADGGLAGPVDSDITADHAAYVIYTSGSTGRPKGVAIAHGNVGRLLDATMGDFGLGPRDVWTQFHSAAFDFSVWEIWGCLATGGRLVIVPYRTSRDPEAFAALIAAERVTVCSQTPSAFAQLRDAERNSPLPASLRLVVLGGEPLDTTPLTGWFDRHPESACRVVNMYGITETTVHVTAQTIGRAEALSGSRSVGRPLPGWHVYVMDEHGRLLPPGVAGELYVGGAGVAGAYVNRPELTAQRFLPDPYAPGLLYRSGDLGRLRPDGRLDHLGRLDGQVQLRGHRVELGEVRARLLDTPGVRAAAVVARHDPADPMAARLDAYIVGDAEPDDVRRHAEAFLPDYMIPATVTRLPALPLTANGKVDDARLPDPSTVPDPGARVADASPSDGSLAGTVRAAWEQVFGFRIGPDDDFFSLGGNSLIAVRLLAELHSAGLPRLAVPQFYRNRTVNRLAAALAEAGAPA